MTTPQWDKFYGALVARVDAFKETWGPTAIPFFRGHGDKSWKLLPTVLRANCEDCADDGGRYIEQCLYFEYVSGAGTLLERNLSPWDIAFSMQHYGLPTRLLDWTENFAVALFFAVSDLRRNNSKAAVIWFLDPYWLNSLMCKREEILDVYDDFEHDYFTYFLADKEKLVDFPYPFAAVYPRRHNPRISAQKGGFTLHSSRRPLQDWYRGILRRRPHGWVQPELLLQPFTLPRTCLPEAETYLELAGVNEYTLFPELSGLCQYLKRRYERHLG
ncbi:MAG TPA: FRG domain-containing protein [Pyrinomonadaceae bacterium]